MSIIYIDEVRYICRLHNGATVLNPYTPIAFYTPLGWYPGELPF